MQKAGQVMQEGKRKFHSMNGKRRILVIEDEPINQEILNLILQDEYDVVAAADGASALETVRAQYDTLSLILLDLNLPDAHGLDILRRLKDDQQYAMIPVIVMTADKEAEVESLSFGAVDFIPKPYPQPKVILARVLRTIELYEDRDIIRWTERDNLTGLYNRDYFYRYASQYDLYHKDAAMDAIVLDINHFHMLNERYGRAYGDQTLKRIGEDILEFVKDFGAMACRRSADTFLVYSPHRSDYADLLGKVSGELSGGSKNQNIARVRMGVYYNVDRQIDIERRFDRAKLAADMIKNSYANPIGIYDESMHASEVFDEQLIEDFQTAIDEKQFQVYYQPKFNIQQEEPMLSSAEALVRWKHPKLGMVSPGVFVPLFENNGLIQKLDDYVWRTAAAKIKDWKERLGLSIPVSINISRVDMYDADFVEKLKSIAEENRLDRGELLLEITESAYTENSGQIINTVKELRDLDFCIEMDDFGSGYSSLNMISTLPIDALKLDMQFIRNAFKERKDTRLLQAVVQLAESMELPTIAEGVETAEQMLALKNMGCDVVQGYYFSRPLPADEFEEYIKDKKLMDSAVSELKKSTGSKTGDRFIYDALHDPLTGLYNNTAFEVLFRDSDKEHIAVLIVDVNDYGAIVKTKGKAYADMVIKRTAGVICGSFRSVDNICRIRNDEFVVIMTRVTGSMRGLVCDKVEQIIARLSDPAEGEPHVSLSVGIAFSDMENPGGDIFRDADAALDKAKKARQGESCYEFFSPGEESGPENR